MTTEIIKGLIAVIVIGAAIFSLFTEREIAQNFLLPLAGFAFGYYFKQVELPITRGVKAAFGPK